MTVLVTGGAGYIGSHVALSLLDRSERVVILDDLSTGAERCIPPAATFIKGDVGDGPLVRDVLQTYGIDSIVHLAGSIIVSESVANPLAYYRNNTANSRTLIEAAVDAGVRHFIFSSTAAVYGEPDIDLIGETTPLAPISPYGSSKLMTEIMLRDAAFVHDLRFVALRYFNVAGADPAGRSGQAGPQSTHLIKIASEAAVGKRPFMQVYGNDYPTSDGTCIRDYVHVTDLAEAHTAALTFLRNGGPNEAFNCGYERGYSVLEVIAAVKRVCGRDFPVEQAPRRLRDPAKLVAATGKLRRAMAWTPEHDNLDDIIRHALAWEGSL